MSFSKLCNCFCTTSKVLKPSLLISVLIVNLVLFANQGLSSSVFAATAAKPLTHKATFTLDGVTVTIDTPFLPGPHFSTSKPGDATQTAAITTPDLNVHPNGAIYITAVPYGTKPTSEGVPVAQAGGAATYRASLYQYRVNEKDNPQPSSVSTLFGQQVTGVASLMLGNVQQAYSSTLVVEWVVEAGKRIWIIRITEEEPKGTVNLAPAASLLASLHFLTISSSTLAHPTTIKGATGVRPLVSNLPTPSWWSGTCDVNNNAGSYPLGATYLGMQACGPLGGTHCAAFGGSSCVYEWQCVELVQRYFVLANLASVYGANGVDIVNYYPNSNMVKYLTSRGDGSQPISQLSIQGKPFQVGDVLSWADMSSLNIPIWSSNGHTAIVTSVSVNGSGNGSFTVLQQNATSSGSQTFSITNWLLQDSIWSGGDQRIVGWLDPSAPPPPPPSSSQSNYTYAAPGQDGHLELFSHGSDSNIVHNGQTAPNSANWNPSSDIISNYVFNGDPAVGVYQGRLEVFARDINDDIAHIGQTAPNGGWDATWGELQANYHFQGTPATANDANGNIEVFARGSDNNIWHNVYTTSWSGWTPLVSGYVFNGDPAVGVYQGRLEVFARDINDNIAHIGQTAPNGGWDATWGELQANYHFQGTPATANDANGNIEVFARGSDNNIWHSVYTNSWSGWTPLVSGYVFNGDPAVGVYQGRLEVFARDINDDIAHIGQTAPNGGWDATWGELQANYHFQGTPATANDANGNIQVFARGSDNNMWHSFYITSWSSWLQL